jgi:hypothetical protein
MKEPLRLKADEIPTQTWTTESHETDLVYKDIHTEEEATNVVDDEDEELQAVFDDIDEQDDEGEEEDDVATEIHVQHELAYSTCFLWRTPPSIPDAHAAKEDLEKTLYPRRDSGYGHKDPKLDLVLRHRIELMRSLLSLYVDPIHGKGWSEASMAVVQIFDQGRWSRDNGKWAA